jgi:cell division protein FtsI (penicillin-binding protein 3)
VTQEQRPPGRPGGGEGRRGPVPRSRRPGDGRPGERRGGDPGARRLRPRVVRPVPGEARPLRDATVRPGYQGSAGGSRPPRTAPGGPRRPPRRFTVRRGEPGRRLGITLLAIVFVLTIFGGRLVQIQGMEAGYYSKKANQLRLRTVPLPALRGTIYGADGQILAMTVETYPVWSDPPQVADKPRAAQELAGPLGMSAATILNLLEHPSSKEYVLLESGVSAANEAKVAALNITGIYEGSPSNGSGTYVRAYPDGDATADVVGFTNVNSSDVITGQAGIEEEYNKLLSGTQGSEQMEFSNQGQPIPGTELKATQAVNGRGIKLTIVPALQLAAQQDCEQEVRATHARQCTVVVIQPKTGYILAMAQWPTYSQATLTSAANAKNRAVEDVFEPGSTAKVITAAAAFEHGGQTPMSSYYIPPAIFRGGQWIHDAEPDGGSRYTIAGIIANSSNIGMSEVVSHVPPQIQYDYLRAFGLGEPSGLNLPGESAGILPPPSQWAPDERYTLSFGQGVAVTAVQMASVYATIANNGVRVQPTLVEGTIGANGQYTPAPPAPSRRVIQAKTAHELIQILQQVPAVDEQANQPWGIIPGYAVASKTGTSQESGPSCPGSLCEYGSSYIGMAPGNGPQVVVAVNVQDPKTKNAYFGDMVAGPVFNHVMNFALQTLQIQPQPGLVAPNVRLNAP